MTHVSAYAYSICRLRERHSPGAVTMSQSRRHRFTARSIPFEKNLAFKSCYFFTLFLFIQFAEVKRLRGMVGKWKLEPVSQTLKREPKVIS